MSKHKLNRILHLILRHCGHHTCQSHVDWPTCILQPYLPCVSHLELKGVAEGSRTSTAEAHVGATLFCTSPGKRRCPMAVLATEWTVNG